MTPITELVGKIPVNITQTNAEEFVIEVEGGQKYTFHHQQDCCEGVHIVDVVGDLEDLLGVALTDVNEVIYSEGCNYGHETWTFFIFKSIKGVVTVRWIGESNGYYSESVDLRIE